MNFRMLCATALLMAAPLAAHAAPETYTLDPSHTNVDWRADHFGFSQQTGKFALVEGDVSLDEQKPANSRVNVTIDMTKLATGNPKFDEHLKSADFLDVATYPKATFASTRVVVTGKNTATIMGDLTLHGVTKPVALKTTLRKIGPSVMTKEKTAGFTATAMIKRSDFGITMAIPGVSDDIALTIAAEANVKTATPAK